MNRKFKNQITKEKTKDFNRLNKEYSMLINSHCSDINKFVNKEINSADFAILRIIHLGSIRLLNKDIDNIISDINYLKQKNC